MDIEFNESTTDLPEAIEDTDKQKAVADWMYFHGALTGKQGDDHLRIAHEVLSWASMLLRKNRDYGSAVWSRPILANVDPGTAMRVRISDKIQRLQNLLAIDVTPEVNESIDDTLRDLGAYCLLELARPGR